MTSILRKTNKIEQTVEFLFATLKKDNNVVNITWLSVFNDLYKTYSLISSEKIISIDKAKEIQNYLNTLKIN